MSPEKLNSFARQLELNVATGRLLNHVFPDAQEQLGAPSRYQFLADLIERDAQLLAALLSEDHAVVSKSWQQMLHEQQANVRFLHGLAVVLRERCLAKHARNHAQADHWHQSTLLWMLLLCCDEFWSYFSRNGRDRPRIDEQDQAKLLYESLRGILSLHSMLAQRAFVAGHLEAARLHVQCLDLCQSGEEAMAAALAGHGVACGLSRNRERMEQVGQMAEELLDDWCAKLVGEAERTTEDAEAIKNLPEGIRKNYEGGIRHLERFLALEVPNVRVLRSLLDWRNDWCYDLYVTRKIELIRQLMTPARNVADLLVPLCTTGRGHTPEDQALSQHFLLRGFTGDDPEQKTKDFEASLEWNPANHNAAELLGDSVADVLGRQLNQAVALAEKARFQEAYEVIESVEEQGKTNSQPQVAERVISECRQAFVFVSIPWFISHALHGALEEYPTYPS